MKAYSADLRQKIVAAYEQGAGTLDEIADVFSIARRSVASYLKLHRSGASLQPKPHGGGVAFSLTEKHPNRVARTSRGKERPDAR